MYAQDTLGLGHVRRSATIARALLAQREDAAVLLASKSPRTTIGPCNTIGFASVPSR